MSVFSRRCCSPSEVEGVHRPACTVSPLTLSASTAICSIPVPAVRTEHVEALNVLD